MSKEEKAKYCFSLFDADNNDQLDKKELTQILKVNYMATSLDQVLC
jgi:Ca2+-binding EF-hand superfamily protein